jgi:biopolymer transport protein ExbB
MTYINQSLLILVCLLISTLTLAQHNTPSENTATTENTTPEVVTQAQHDQAQQDIDMAYKKEMALLSSQVHNLKERIGQFKNNARQAQVKIESEVNTLESQLLTAENQARALENEHVTLLRNQQSVEDNQQLLEATLAQAKSSMSAYDISIKEDEDLSKLEQVQARVNKVSDFLIKQSQTYQTDGQFYLADGTSVDGQLLHIGRIATYGHSDQGGGALAPAGEGQLKVWEANDSAAVAALFNGKSEALSPVFIYESTLNAIEEKKKKTILSVIESGGVIAWIIFALGLIALVLIILRFIFLKKSSASTEKMMNAVVREIEQKDLQSAIAKAQTKNSASARVLLSALRNIKRNREHIEDIVSESILHESALLNRFGSMILVIATVTPLLGLLGTVTGMISTFDIITEFGTGDPKLLSSGISIALVTTEIGLAVAIPALLFGNLLSGWSERIKDDMEKAALRAINVYQKTVS